MTILDSLDGQSVMRRLLISERGKEENQSHVTPVKEHSQYLESRKGKAQALLKSFRRDTRPPNALILTL